MQQTLQDCMHHNPPSTGDCLIPLTNRSQMRGFHVSKLEYRRRCWTIIVITQMSIAVLLNTDLIFKHTIYIYMYYHPLFRIRSWNNRKRCMSRYILILTVYYCLGNRTGISEECLNGIVPCVNDVKSRNRRDILSAIDMKIIQKIKSTGLFDVWQDFGKVLLSRCVINSSYHSVTHKTAALIYRFYINLTSHDLHGVSNHLDGLLKGL